MRALVWGLGVLGVSALLSTASVPASAAVLDVSDILTQFNAVVTGSFSSGHDVEGRLVAGSINGGATFYSSPNALSAPSSYAAVTTGALNACSSCNINHGGSVAYATKANGVSFNFNGGGGYVPTSLTMSDFTTPLNSFVTTLSGLSANSTVNSQDPNNFTFNVTPDADGLAIFSVSAATLATANNILFSSETATTIVIDVTGAPGYAFAQGGGSNFNGDTYLDEHVIWNFEDASSLSLKYWHGAILAANAAVTNSSPLEGFLYANSFVGNGELHDRPFLGSMTGLRTPLTPVVAAPEPSTWAMMGLGFAGLGFVGWRRARRAAVAA